MKTILILGGHGATGRLLVRYLRAHTDAAIIVAGRSLAKAQQLVDEAGDARLQARQADAGDTGSLEKALAGVDLCLVAAPTTHQVTTVIQACLSARVDYLDIQFSKRKLQALYAAQSQIENAGLCFITEAGYHPGLPSAMVRFAATRLDVIESALTAGYLNIGPETPYTEAVDELMEAFIDYEAQVYKHGRWTSPGSWDTIQFDFGGPVGKRTCYSMYFEELACLPQMYPALRDTGFYISGSNWVADLLVTPIVMAGLKVAPQRGLRPLGKLMWWAMQKSKPPYQVMIAVQARGTKDGRPRQVRASVSHPDGYELTAIPVVAYLKQYLEGTGRRPGLHMMGQLAEPVRLFRDMESMGASIACVED